jgi:hypothetical protein
METQDQTHVAEIQVKKKGRPRKTPLPPLNTVQEVPQGEQEKKKRGRKKKEKVEEEEVKQKKKRGRKAAIKFFSSSIRKKIPLTTVIQDTDKTILHLDINESNVENTEITKDGLADTDIYEIINGRVVNDEVLNNADDTNNTNNANNVNANGDLNGDVNEEDIIELYEKRLQLRMNQDSFLTEKLENLHNDDNLFNKLLQREMENNAEVKKENFRVTNEENRKKKFFCLFDDIYANKTWVTETNISCWWCCHNFNSLPLGLPTKYEHKKFTVKGLFCSFACMLAYNKNDNKHSRKNEMTLIHFLYKKLTGILVDSNKELFGKSLINTLPLEHFDNDKELRDSYIEGLLELRTTTLQEAPPRCALKIFGGELSIEEFRASTKEHKIHKLIEYPLSICRDYVEEVDIKNVKRLNLRVFNKTNMVLDNSKIEEVKIRLNTSEQQQQQQQQQDTGVVNSMDRFIRF